MGYEALGPKARKVITLWSGVILALVVLVQPGEGADKTIKLFYPDTSASYQPVVEFHARGDDHAFVALGREYTNGFGATFYYAVVGFYPRDNTFKNILYGPGTLYPDVPDEEHDTTFKVYVTDEQEQHVLFILKNWDTKKAYSILQNCTDLVKDISNNLGLKTGVASLSSPLQEPSDVVNYLKQNNSPTQPLRDVEIERALRHQEKSPIYVGLGQRMAAYEKRQTEFPSAGPADSSGAPPTFPIFTIPDSPSTPYGLIMNQLLDEKRPVSN